MRNLRVAEMLSAEAIVQADSAYLQTLLRPAGYFRQKTLRLQELTAFILASYGKTDSVKCGVKKSPKIDMHDAAHSPDSPILDEQGSLELLVISGTEKTCGDEHPAIGRMFGEPTEKLRRTLLERKGVGPETADSILLYAGNHAVFVVDAYTRRIFERHQLPANDYETIRLLVECALKREHGAPAGAGDRLTRRQPACPEIHQPSAISAAYRSELAQRYNEFHALLVQIGKHYCLKKAPKCANCPLACFLPMSDNAQAGVRAG
jgi:endonuclease III-like uncharacterized protein